MTTKEILRKIMAGNEKLGRAKIKNAVIANRIGISSPAVYERITQNNMSIKNFCELLAAMDYELVAQPCTGAKRRPEGCFKVEWKPEEKEK